MTNYHADTVIRRANVITIDPTQPRATAVAMRAGRFIGVGADSDVETLIGPGTTILDMGGKTVLPGFIDAHIHVLSSGTRHVMAADCALPTIADIQDALRERAASTPAGEWVQGFKFDDTKTAENRFLRREDLDAVSASHPILVAHRAGHVYYGNSLALERAGFNDETPDPAGGRLGRHADTGRLDGVIYERAADDLRENQLPVESPETRRQGLRTICQMLNRVGLTSVHDARVTDYELRTYQEGRDAGELSLRVYALMFYRYFPALRDAGIRSGMGDNHLRIGGDQDGCRRRHRLAHRLPVSTL